MVTEDFVRRAVDEADPNALRLALYQATGDPELAAIELERPTDGSGAGGSTDVVKMAHADTPALKEKAVRFLLDKAPTFVPEVPDDDELRRLMEMLRGEHLTEAEFRYGKDACAFAHHPRSAAWTDTKPELPPGFRVAVIGAGFSGVGVGVQLGRLGIPYTIYERQDEPGGVWSINTYPDARVDTTNFMYQFRFVKNYPWTEYFARGEEVRGYIARVAEEHGVMANIRFGVDVLNAEFDDEDAEWRLTVAQADGARHEIRANVVITAMGLFSTPRDLEVDGIEDFRGSIVHTARWTGEEEIDGKRVAVIGNGSTGVQLLSAIAEHAEHVTVIQRTPQWIIQRARYGEPVTDETQWLFAAMPYYWNWYTYSIHREANGSQVLHEPDPEWQAAGGTINEANDKLRDILTAFIHESLESRPDLVAKVTPSHAPMARRLIVDNGWYRALLRDNVELVATGIEQVTPNGIRTSDGVEHPVDLIVAAIGFSVTRYLHPTEFKGPDGTTLQARWQEEAGPRAHLGLTVPGFPNLFIMYGPNAQPRSGSLVSFVEAWAAYAAQAVVYMLEGGYRQIEVRREVFDDYNARVDARSAELVYLDPMSKDRNYYVNEWGRQQVNEPWRVEEYYCMLLDLDVRDFDLS
jgi:4-hydroxyacetophenone monooxygenase